MNFNTNYVSLQFPKRRITKEMFMEIQNKYKKDNNHELEENEKEKIKEKYNITQEQLNAILGLKKNYPEPKVEVKRALLFIARSEESDNLRKTSPLTDENIAKTIAFITNKFLKAPSIDLPGVVNTIIEEQNIISPKKQVLLYSICSDVCRNVAERTDDKEHKIGLLKDAYFSHICIYNIITNNKKNKYFTEEITLNNYKELLNISKQLVENDDSDFLSECEAMVSLCDYVINKDKSGEKYKVLLQKVYFLEAAKNYIAAIETLTDMKTSFPEKIQELDNKIKAIESAKFKPVKQKMNGKHVAYVIDDADKAIMKHKEEIDKTTQKGASLKEKKLLSDFAYRSSNTPEISNGRFFPKSKKDIQPIFDENITDTISLKATKRFRFEKEVTIDIPNTNKARTLYTQTQYTLSDILNFKPLGVRSLSKAITSNQIIPDSLICLNNSKEKPLYAMELNLDNFKEKQKLSSIHEKESQFSIVKIMGQYRLIYSKCDEFSNIQHYIVLDKDISRRYAHNNMTDNIIKKSQTIINPKQHFESETYFITDSETVKSNLFQTRSIFDGSILGEDVKNALDVLNLSANQLFETDIAGNLYYKDANGKKVHTGICLSQYPDLVTLSLINYNCNEGDDISGKSKLEETIKSVNDGDTSQNRARFFFQNGNCYFTVNKSRLSKDRQFTVNDMKTLYSK